MANEERTYRFGDETITAAVDIPVDDVRSVWEAVHPALANAEYQEEENGDVTFSVRAGTKG